MGMDLIGAGFTRRTDRECSVELIDSLIDAIPTGKIEDKEWLDAVDPSGYLGDELEVGDIRDALKEGAREYDSALSGHRMSTDYYIQGTPLTFIWTGGGSWGDDPYDGFTALCYFINLASMDDAVREAAAFVCSGLPGAVLVAKYAGA